MCRYPMKRVGITGGIGCGKSTVVAEFERLGVACFVADRVAASYYEEADFLREIEQLFGSDVLKPDGSADKRKIASIVFNDHRRLEQLNALVHPRVMLDFDSFCRLHSEDDYVLFESAILYEYGLDRRMDLVVGVYVDLEERIRRLALRDHTDRASIGERVRNQQPAEVVLEKADYIVLNYEGNPRHRQVVYFDYCIRRNKGGREGGATCGLWEGDQRGTCEAPVGMVVEG